MPSKYPNENYLKRNILTQNAKLKTHSFFFLLFTRIDDKDRDKERYSLKIDLI